MKFLSPGLGLLAAAEPAARSRDLSVSGGHIPELAKDNEEEGNRKHICVFSRIG